MAIASTDFAALAVGEFPELRPDVEDEVNRGLVHCEVGALAQFVQAAKGRADWSTYERAMRFVDRLLSEADPALENALYVSFLEHVDFNGSNGRRAWSHLSERLRKGWRELNDGWGRPRPEWMD